MVADMHGGVGSRFATLQGFVEQPGVGLGDADVLGAQRELEIVRQAQAAHVALPLVTTPRAK
ncbi:hypothetical protein BME99_30465 [Pseudomonas protegens]|nr:hypothetical protein BME99_30465 [Pseudomonas protegens]